MKPSEVFLAAVPLVGTLDHAEAEFAASLIVRVCQVDGDAFAPVISKRVGEVLKADSEAKTEPMASLLLNPFFRPDFYDLVERGFARWLGEPGKSPLELTEGCVARLERWRVPAPAAKEGA